MAVCASPFANDFYRGRGYCTKLRSEDIFYLFSSQKKSRFASDLLRRGNRASFRSFEKGLADRGGWCEEILHMPEIQVSFLYPSSCATLGEGGHISGELFGLLLGVCLSPTRSKNRCCNRRESPNFGALSCVRSETSNQPFPEKGSDKPTCCYPEALTSKTISKSKTHPCDMPQAKTEVALRFSEGCSPCAPAEARR